MVTVGIDVSKATLDVIVMDETQQTAYIQLSNDGKGYAQLKRWLTKHDAAGSVVCLEATGHYSDGVAEYLFEAGYRVSVVNPARIKGYAQSQMRRNKTDKLDARLIADFARTQSLEVWTPPPPELRELQALVRHLAALEETKQQCANRLREATAPLVISQLQAQLAFLADQIKALHKAIHDHIDQNPSLKRQRDLIASIPGLGDLSAAKLLAECRPLTNFDNVRQLVAFAGLNPTHHDSGSSIHKKAHISKCGNSAIRAALYMPAIVAKRHNPLLRTFAQRLLDQGLAPMAVVVAVMRKLLHLVFGVLKSGCPFDPNFASAS